MAEKITLLSEIAAFLGQGYCLHRFLGSFLVCRIQDRGKLCGLAVTFVWGFMKAVLYEWAPFGSGSLSGLYKLLFQSVFLLIVAFCFYHAEKRITAFLLVTFLSLSEISFFAGYVAMTLSAPILGLEVRLFEQGYIEVAFFENMLQFTSAALQVLCCILWVMILALSLRKLTESFREKEYEMHRVELFFILTPSLVGLLLCVFLRIIMVTVENGMPTLLYDRYPILWVLIPAILLLSLLSIFYSVKLFQDMISLNREKSSRIVLEQQVEILQDHTREMERLYTGARSVKHDIKNTLAVLMRLSEEGPDGRIAGGMAQDGEGMGGESIRRGMGASRREYADYLTQLNRSFEKLELHFQTGNAAADALLNMKYHEAMQKIPDLEFQADALLFPGNLVIQSYDISVILGNALDNALEACLRLKGADARTKPFLRVASFERGKFFFLEVENSFDGVLHRSVHSEFPETLKEEKQMHGIGFSNMKKTAEKYDGGVDYSVSAAESDPEGRESASGYAIFTLSVMMKNERRKEKE